jgi:protein-L-isoaspartate(D-aspartate) O-methyltransferase
MAISYSTNGCGQERSDANWNAQRRALVLELQHDSQLKDEAVLAAIGKVPRHLFIPEGKRGRAYENHAQPIGYSQTISQPFIVAYMTQALKLKPTDRVLEIGTGSGYHAAVMSLLAKEIYSIEIVPELGARSAKLLDTLGYANVQVRVGDGYRGWPERAPFDAIILTAAPAEIPQPLIDQLAAGGRLIAPVGEDSQSLVLLERTRDGITRKELLPVVFVPMTGEARE